MTGRTSLLNVTFEGTLAALTSHAERAASISIRMNIGEPPNRLQYTLTGLWIARHAGCGQVAGKPHLGQPGNLAEGTLFLEKMCGADYDLKLLLDPQMREGLAIHVDDREVEVSYNEQRGRIDARQSRHREIRASASGNHRSYSIRTFRRGYQRCGSAGTGAKVADAHPGCFRILTQPIRSANHAFREQPDIETQPGRSQVLPFFVGGEQVKQQRGQAGLPEHLCDMPISRAVPAAAAAVREQHHAEGAIGSGQVAFECDGAGGDLD